MSEEQKRLLGVLGKVAGGTLGTGIAANTAAGVAAPIGALGTTVLGSQILPLLAIAAAGYGGSKLVEYLKEKVRRERETMQQGPGFRSGPMWNQ